MPCSVRAVTPRYLAGAASCASIPEAVAFPISLGSSSLTGPLLPARMTYKLFIEQKCEC